MASLVKRDGTYYIQFCDVSRHPSTKRHSLKTKRRDLARRYRADLERRYETGDYDPWLQRSFDRQERPRKTLSLVEAGERFLEQKRRDLRSPNTLRTYREILSLLSAAVGAQKALAALQQRDLAGFIKDPGLSSATRYKRFTHLRTFFRWCLAEGLLKASPLDRMAAPDKPHKIPKGVREEELERICQAIRSDYEDKLRKGVVNEGEMIWRIPLFQFAYYTGMRASELARLRWKDIDMERHLIYIHVQKNKKGQTIPLNGKAEAILARIGVGAPEVFVFHSPRHAQQTERGIRNVAERASLAFREAKRRAGIERPISLHGLRHGFCTRLAEAGMSAFTIQAAARHADVSTSARYVSIANEKLKAEIDEVFGDDARCGRLLFNGETY